MRLQTSEGQSSTITFQCADVDTPILSIRRLAMNGHEIRFTEKGGYILHLKTGHRTKFVIHDGVYFIKLKQLNPPANEKNIRVLPRPGGN